MNVADAEDQKRDRSSIAMAGFIIAVIAAFAVLVSGPGTAQGIWPYGIGLPMFGIGALIGALAAIVCLVGIIAAVRAKRTARAVHGVVGFAIGLSLAGLLAYIALDARKYPLIHDATTNLADPPHFVILSERVDEDPFYTEAEWRERHGKANSDLKPIALTLSVAEAVERAGAVAESMGWEIAGKDPATGRLEATATTRWFGFKDDVVIRVREAEGGSLMDLRSVSRVGGGDIGANANRIREFAARITADHN